MCSCVSYWNELSQKVEIVPSSNAALTVPSMVTFARNDRRFVGHKSVDEVRCLAWYTGSFSLEAFVSKLLLSKSVLFITMFASIYLPAPDAMP